jgi:bacterioferritin
MGMEQSQQGFTHGPDVLTLLNRDLANEMNTMLMYMADSLTVKGTDSHDVKSVLSKFVKEDFKHAQRLATRIVDLEGTPELTPDNLGSNASIDVKPPVQELQPMLKDALEHEMQSVIEYRNQIQNIGFNDPATRLLLEELLTDKEHQAEEIRHMLGV